MRGSISGKLSIYLVAVFEPSQMSFGICRTFECSTWETRLAPPSVQIA